MHFPYTYHTASDLGYIRNNCVCLSHVMVKEQLKQMRTAKVQASLRIRTVSPEHMLFTHVSVGGRSISAKELDMWPSSRKHAYMILTPLNPTFI